MNLGKMFEDACSTYKDNTALVFEDSRFRYKDLNGTVSSLANHLKSLGIGKGDKVALMLPNVPEFPITYFACQKLGAVAVTLNVMSTSYELQYLLDNSDSKVLITAAQSARRFEEIKDRLATCRHLLLTEVDDGPMSMKKALEAGPFECEPSDAAENDPAVMIYTSGLTGKPLGAVLTHGNLLSQTMLLKTLFAATQADKALCLIPLFHSFGAVANMLNPMLIGACVVMLDAFSIESIFKSIETEKITYVSAVPRVFLGMLLQEGAGSFDVSSLKFCVTGGSAMPPAYMPQFEKKFKVRLREGYGLTEASPVCSVTRLDMEQKPGSIGVPIPGLEARIVDDSDRDLARGEIGELIVRGPNVMEGLLQGRCRHGPGAPQRVAAHGGSRPDRCRRSHLPQGPQETDDHHQRVQRLPPGSGDRAEHAPHRPGFQGDREIGPHARGSRQGAYREEGGGHCRRKGHPEALQNLPVLI